MKIPVKLLEMDCFQFLDKPMTKTPFLNPSLHNGYFSELLHPGAGENRLRAYLFDSIVGNSA